MGSCPNPWCNCGGLITAISGGGPDRSAASPMPQRLDFSGKPAAEFEPERILEEATPLGRA